jgi:energy-coupling factor transporter transmembrane protein EcfT
MKIQRETPDQLIIENNPIWVAFFISIFALIFIAAGLFVMTIEFWFGLWFAVCGVIIGVVFNIAFSRRTQIILDRPGNLIELRRKSMLGYKKRVWELRYLDRVVIQTSRSDKSTTYRAAMVFSDGMDAGTHPITFVYSSGNGAETAKTAINRWLAASLDTSAQTT